MKKLILFLFCFWLSSCQYIIGVKDNETNEIIAPTYQVVGIKDGDSIELLIDGKSQVIRLANIDCPELKQPFGKKAKQFVSDKIFGKEVMLLHENGYDRNGRLVAEILLLDSTNLNKDLVVNGLAWHYIQYSDDDSYQALEDQARKERIGLWSENHPIAPWDWRHQRMKNQ